MTDKDKLKKIAQIVKSANAATIAYEIGAVLAEGPEKGAALRTMVDKLDNRRPESNGYVTYLPELKAILNELSDRVPVGVHLD